MPSVLAAPRVGSQVLGTLKYLCFIPDMSSELFRALTSAPTAHDPPGRKKPMTHSTRLEGPAAKMAARQSGQKARAGVHARRNETARQHYYLTTFHSSAAIPLGKRAATNFSSLEVTAAKMAAR